MRSLLRTVLTVAVTAALVYLLLCAAAWTGQRRLLYHPDANLLRDFPEGTQTLELRTSDGETLQAWWMAPPNALAPVLLYLHGNGGNLDMRAVRLAALREDGFGVLAISWRGYGGSTGEPSQQGWGIDALRGYEELRRRGFAPQRIVLFGESLGSAQAVLLAAEQPVGALLLDSAFDSAAAVARHHYPWLPVGLIMQDPYRADLAAPRIKVPVLQVHCRLDEVSPLARAEALHGLLHKGSQLLVLDDQCHVPRFEQYRAKAREFLQGLPHS